MPRSDSPEGRVQRQCLDWLQIHGFFYHRLIMKPMPGRSLPFGCPAGLTDIIAVDRQGLYVGIECKAPVANLTPAQKVDQAEHDLDPEQKVIRDRILRAGGRHIVAWSTDDLKVLLK